MDDSGEIITQTICSTCWYEDQRICNNINGRCDRCGGADFIETGPILDETREIELPELPPDEDEIEIEGVVSSREKVQSLVEDLRHNPRNVNPLRKSERFWDGIE